MKVSYNWLKDYLDFALSAEEVAEILTDTGLEVESVEKLESVKGGLEGVVIGKVLTKEKHPDADRLNVTTVDIGNGKPLQIVCGAPNVESGQKVVVATVGCTLYPEPETPLKIKRSKIRGVESEGMICAEDELGIGNSHDGIMVLDASVEIGKQAAVYFKLQEDYIFEIGLTPNRNDAMSHIGVSRDLKAYLNSHHNTQLQIRLPEFSLPKEENQAVKVKIEDKSGSIRYMGAVINGVKIQASPEWLQKKLRSIGLNPINNVVDITNFVMHECGHPLHAFDLDNVGGEIVVRRAKKGETLVTLDEVERKLSEDDLMICNASKPMCIAGVFGGLNSGVSENTTGLFLEAACFDPVSVRKTSKRHILNTDSSFRFERGVDPNTVDWALHRAVSLILEIAGGTLGQTTDDYPHPVKEKEVDFNYNRCRSLTGLKTRNDLIDKILSELDIKIKDKKENTAVMVVPTYRADVDREADLIEEFLRIYGFNQVSIPEKLNTSISLHAKPDPEKIYNTTANLLADNGFYEIMNNSLVSSSIWEKVKSDCFSADQDVHLLNPLSNELDVLRQTLLFGGLKNIEYNQNRQHTDLKFFEFGTLYTKTDKGHNERRSLSLWMTGQKETENWTSDSKEVSFYDLKGCVDSIFNKLGIYKNPSTTALNNDLLTDGYTLNIAGKSVAQLGWIGSDILDLYGIKKPVFYADINWDLVLELSVMNKIAVKPVPKTQFVRRDFSLLLNKEVSFQSIRDIAFKVDKKILRKVGLFDVYEGKNLEAGKKSYAVSFIFQDDEKTLKDAQLDAVMDRIRENLEKELKASLR